MPSRFAGHARLHLAASAIVALATILATAAPLEAASAVLVTHGPRDRREVALTFDDGWSLETCRSVVATLRRTHATATFFITGGHVAEDPVAWRAILDGFPVANHTFSHPFLTRIRGYRIRQQIVSAEETIEKALGRPMLKVLRPPFGAYDGRVLRIAGELGYRHVLLWDTSSGDTSSAATVERIVHNATRGGSGSVVLMHCGPSATAAALPAIIQRYRAAGYRLVTLERLLGAGT